MKIRIKDNSVRLRLTRSEVDAMRDQGEVIAMTRFPGGQQLRYALQSSAAVADAAATFANDEIRVVLPASAVQEWAASEQVSIANGLPLGDDDELSILVEKDFACLAPRPGEDESDMFAHPDAGTVNC